MNVDNMPAPACHASGAKHQSVFQLMSRRAIAPVSGWCWQPGLSVCWF